MEESAIPNSGKFLFMESQSIFHSVVNSSALQNVIENVLFGNSFNFGTIKTFIG